MQVDLSVPDEAIANQPASVLSVPDEVLYFVFEFATQNILDLLALSLVNVQFRDVAMRYLCHAIGFDRNTFYE